MAGKNVLVLLLVSSVWMYMVSGREDTSTISQTGTFRATKCSDAEVYLSQDWNIFVSCCEAIYPNGSCPISCPCQNGASCIPNNRTCVCRPGWVGSHCQRSCREESNDTYGPGCEKPCRCGPDARCEPVTGACYCDYQENCSQRCPRNRYGPRCRKKCRCKTGGCDQTTGACSVQGVQPSKCNCQHGGWCRAEGKPCRCTAAWAGRTCDSPCLPGFYGEDCSILCGCRDNSTCDRHTGLCLCAAVNQWSCVSRCPDGFFGPRCSDVCNCTHNLSCNQWSGNCECTNDTCRGSLQAEIPDFSTSTTVHTGSPTTPPPITTNSTRTTEPLSKPTPALVTDHETTATNTGSTARQQAAKEQTAEADSVVVSSSNVPVPVVSEGSPYRDKDGGPANGAFYPTAAFWGVVSSIAVLLLAVVVLLLLILRKQIYITGSPLTRRSNICRRDNVYETVDEISKVDSSKPDIPGNPPPLPDMFQRGGNIRSSLHNYYNRPLSVHSPLPAMDTPLPASVAAMVCSNYGREGLPPVAGVGTSRRSLMAEWRPHGRQETQSDSRDKSRSQSDFFDDSQAGPKPQSKAQQSSDRSNKALSCIYNGIAIEDDYADPIDSIADRGKDAANRPPGYLPKLFSIQDNSERQTPVQGSNFPTGVRGSPRAERKSNSPMTIQRPESPLSPHHSSPSKNISRSESPMSLHQSGSNMNLHYSEPKPILHSDSNMNVRPRNSPLGFSGGINSSPSQSPQRHSCASPDPFYFTLEQQDSPMGSPAGEMLPDDDYDELEPQSTVNSLIAEVSISEKRPASRTNSEHSRASSVASSRGSVTAYSPTLASPFSASQSPPDMFAALDQKQSETTRSAAVPQRPLSSNTYMYESCGSRTAPPIPPDDDGVYSRLNRAPSQRSELAACDITTQPDDSAYGRLQRSYSAKCYPRAPEGRLPQRSRSAMIRSHQQIPISASECEAGEWVLPVDCRPRLPPRAPKPPLVTQPRKKFRWSIKGKKQMTKKCSTDEAEFDYATSSATLPYPDDCKRL